MGKTFLGKATVEAGPSGDIGFYKDPTCTQPVDEVTEVDFGVFPWQPTGARQSTKSVTVYAKNEANVPMKFFWNVNDPANPNFPVLTISVRAVGNGGSDVKVPLGQVVPLELRAWYSGDAVTNPLVVPFQVKFITMFDLG